MNGKLGDSESNGSVVRPFPRAGAAPADQIPPEVRDVYRSLGIDLSVANGSPDWRLPLAATYVISRDGIIQNRFVDADYVRRMEPADILAALRKLR